MSKHLGTETAELDNNTIDLTLDDLDLADIEVKALASDETVGVPDLGASLSYNSCSSITL